MIEPRPDCGHDCCDERRNPFHDHFLPSSACPPCVRDRERLAGVEDAANLLAEQMANAPAAVVESVLSDDRAFYLTDANGTLYLAEPYCGASGWAAGTVVQLYRLTVQSPEPPTVVDLMERLEASLAAARATLSGTPQPPDPPGEAFGHASPAAPSSVEATS